LAINCLICGRVLAVDPFGVSSCPSGEKSRAIDSMSALFQAASNVFTSFWSAAPSRELSAGGLAALSALPARAIGKDEKKIETHKAVNDVLAIWKSILKLLSYMAGIVSARFRIDHRANVVSSCLQM
jgi:hypothetical protein